MDKQIELLDDATNKQAVSNCCGASIIQETFCQLCHEHCEDSREEELILTARQLTINND